MDSGKQEKESSDAEWDARHQEAVDSAEQWKAFADRLGSEKEAVQQQLAAVSAELQVSRTAYLEVDSRRMHSCKDGRPNIFVWHKCLFYATRHCNVHQHHLHDQQPKCWLQDVQIIVSYSLYSFSVYKQSS